MYIILFSNVICEKLSLSPVPPFWPFWPLWRHLWPDLKMTSVKIVDLVRLYLMPFTACRYLSPFPRSPGGGQVLTPPAVRSWLRPPAVRGLIQYELARSLRSLARNNVINDYLFDHSTITTLKPLKDGWTQNNDYEEHEQWWLSRKMFALKYVSENWLIIHLYVVHLTVLVGACRQQQFFKLKPIK